MERQTHSTYSLLLGGALISMVGLAQIPEHVQNPEFAPGKAIPMEEATPSLKVAQAEWQTAQQQKADCKKGPARVLRSGGKIEVTAFKEKTVPVKGTLSRALAEGHVHQSILKGNGFIDLSSWDSKVPARDYRIQKYVLGVEEPGAVLPFNFEVSRWVPGQGKWNADFTIQAQFRGLPLKIALPASMTVEGKSVRVTTQPGRFKFLSETHRKAFEKLMSLCNHQFLASYVDLSLDVVFDETCTP